MIKPHDKRRFLFSDATVTANVYSHLMPGAQADAAEAVDRLFAGLPG